MLDDRSCALILAAGLGSRLQPLPEGVNKCALDLGGQTPIAYTVAALRSAGVGRFIVVVGHAAPSVRRALQPLSESCDIRFVHNEGYDYHGCNYSLALGARWVAPGDHLLIAEGDSLLDGPDLGAVARCAEDAACLIRPAEFVSPKRSVLALGDRDAVTRFAYDPAHGSVLERIEDGETLHGESLQLWALQNRPLQLLLDLLADYRASAEAGAWAHTHSGVHSINAARIRFRPIPAAPPYRWINLNTSRDVTKAREWLCKRKS